MGNAEIVNVSLHSFIERESDVFNRVGKSVSPFKKVIDAHRFFPVKNDYKGQNVSALSPNKTALR